MDAAPKAVSLVEELSLLMERHEVPFNIYNDHKDWILPYGTLPGIRALWYPYDDSDIGCLEVDVILARGEIINECFAGVGAGGNSKSDAFINFMISSFHVLLAAFWRKNDPSEVTTKRWRIGEKTYSVFIGGISTRGGLGVEPEIPDGVLESIETAVKRESLTGDCYWVRHFFSDLEGKQSFEALLNNKVWEPGLQALKAIRWPKSSGYYSARNFMVLRATPYQKS